MSSGDSDLSLWKPAPPNSQRPELQGQETQSESLGVMVSQVSKGGHFVPQDLHLVELHL